MTKKSINLSGAELEIMRVLWKLGPATAKDVQSRMPKGKDPAYSTVITLLQRMEAKGAVTHTKSGQGKAFVFHPALKPEQARKLALRTGVKRYFQNDPVPVFATLVENRKLKPDEIEQLRDILNKINKNKK